MDLSFNTVHLTISMWRIRYSESVTCAIFRISEAFHVQIGSSFEPALLPVV